MLLCLSKLFYPLAELDVGRGANGNDYGDCEKVHLSSPELLSPSPESIGFTSPIQVVFQAPDSLVQVARLIAVKQPGASKPRASTHHKQAVTGYAIASCIQAKD